jgi:hypothetical protein
MSDLEGTDQVSPPIGALLNDGIDTFLPEDITFTKYVRVVLPLDGFVFWVKAGLLSDETIISAGAINTAQQISVRGAFHIGTSQAQEEDATFATNQVVLTTKTEVADFNEVTSSELYIAKYNNVRFAFNTNGMYSPNADLYHYVGIAIYSVMGSQIIDDVSEFDTETSVVSNSLPIWLWMNSYEKKSYESFDLPVTLYPSFLIPTNVPPPYGVVHIGDDTVPLAGGQTISATTTVSHLVKDKVRVTLYGVRNDEAIEFIGFVQQIALDTEYFGIQNIPIVRDAKRTQTELSVIAQKKIIDFEINYDQVRVGTVARALISSAVPSYTVV